MLECNIILNIIFFNAEERSERRQYNRSVSGGKRREAWQNSQSNRVRNQILACYCKINSPQSAHAFTFISTS